METHSTLLLFENEKPEMESNLCPNSAKIMLKVRVSTCESEVRLTPNYALHVTSSVIGASLSEPHTNGTSMHACSVYIMVLGIRPSLARTASYTQYKGRMHDFG